MYSRPYALDIVDDAVRRLVVTPGSLIDRLDRAFGVLHPVIPLEPSPSWAKQHERFVAFYVLFGERGDGIMKAGISKTNHVKRAEAAMAVMALQRALLLEQV